MMRNINLFSKKLLIIITLLSLASCASYIKKGDEFAEQEEWSKAVIEYRKAYRDDPKSIEIRSHLKQMEFKAADYYYHRGE